MTMFRCKHAFNEQERGCMNGRKDGYSDSRSRIFRANVLMNVGKRQSIGMRARQGPCFSYVPVSRLLRARNV